MIICKMPSWCYTCIPCGAPCIDLLSTRSRSVSGSADYYYPAVTPVSGIDPRRLWGRGGGGGAQPRLLVIREITPPRPTPAPSHPPHRITSIARNLDPSRYKIHIVIIGFKKRLSSDLFFQLWLDISCKIAILVKRF